MQKLKSIAIDNKILSCRYGIELSSKAFILYLRLLVEEKINGEDTFTIDELAAINKKSIQSTRPTTQELVEAEIIDKCRACKKDGRKYQYYFDTSNSDYEKGFTLVSVADVLVLLTQLDYGNINESMVRCILFIHWKTQYSNLISQFEIALNLGVERDTVSKMCTTLEEKGYIPLYVNRKKEWLGGGKFIYKYKSNLI